METKQEDIEKLLDLSFSYSAQLYRIWDKGDCSTVGLARILLIQEILKESHKRKEQYDGQYDELLDSLLNEYKT